MLEVSAAELVGSESNNAHRRPGPSSVLALHFEQIRQPPRKEHEFVIRFLDTVLGRAERS